MPLYNDSLVTLTNSKTSGATSPKMKVYAWSPCHPFNITPKSIETMSPFFNGVLFGKPCTTTSFTDAQIL